MEPTKESATVVLKNALNEVMIPARGIWNAKLESVPLAFVISIVDPKSVRPCALLPKPTKAGSPASPPAIVVKATGSPDANGIIAPVPAAPVAPVAPVAPKQPLRIVCDNTAHARNNIAAANPTSFPPQAASDMFSDSGQDPRISFFCD